MNPRVTVLITTWNRAHFLPQAIESVQKQSFQEWEIIIADNGSSDGTAEVGKKYQAQDQRIAYHYSPHLPSIAAISNFGLSRARGEYIAILDDDDYWLDPDKLKKQVHFLDTHPDYIACGGGIVMVNKDNKELSRALKAESDEQIHQIALFANPIVNSTSLFRRHTGKDAQLYDETLANFADWEYWLRLGTQGKFYNFPQYFTGYRLHAGSASFNNQRSNARCAVRIVNSYKRQYPGYLKGLIYAYGYLIYTYFPAWIRKKTYDMFSILKKKLFTAKTSQQAR